MAIKYNFYYIRTAGSQKYPQYQSGFALVIKNKNLEIIDEIFAPLTDTSIENLPIRFSAIATDLLSGQEIILDKGSLKKAIMASSAIPAIFPPVRIDGHLLIDGSTSDSVPVHVLKERGADRIIAVNVSKCVRKIGPISNALHILYRSDEIATYHLTQERLAGDRETFKNGY